MLNEPFNGTHNVQLHGKIKITTKNINENHENIVWDGNTHDFNINFNPLSQPLFPSKEISLEPNGVLRLKFLPEYKCLLMPKDICIVIPLEFFKENDTPIKTNIGREGLIKKGKLLIEHEPFECQKNKWTEIGHYKSWHFKIHVESMVYRFFIYLGGQRYK